MSLDLPSLVAELGGGLSAVALIALAFAVVTLWRRNSKLQDARIADHKAHAAQIVDTIRTLDRAIEYAERRNG